MEQDPPMDSAGELPTYEQLAAQHGPNSRFGRWQGWVEKRAAERYADDTPEKLRARKMRGWGPHVVVEDQEDPPPDSSESLSSLQPSLSRTQTVLSETKEKDAESPVPLTPVTTAQALPPSHLQLHTFGSRFLPHSEQPILSLLPICNDAMLLMGHADGLSVLILRNEESVTSLDAEPRRRDIWRGQGVYQLDILESESSSPFRTPQGVVLALVGTDIPESASEKDSKGPHRAIRMYSLASLVKLARWAASRKEDECLDAVFLTQSQDMYSKRMKPRIKPLKLEQTSSLMSLDTTIPPPVPPKDPIRGPITASSSSTRLNSVSSGWNIVDHGDFAVQWMTDYVPLASPGSRLVNQTVNFFELLRSPGESRVTARLIIATKQNMFLYETVQGERAFRFVKEFYTPLPARSVTFIYQSSQEFSLVPRSPESTTTLGSYDSSTNLLHSSPASHRWGSSPMYALPSSTTGQLSLFVAFEKKAGLIRVSDSAVGELDLWEAPSHSRWSSAHLTSSSSSSSAPFRLSMGSFDSLSIGKESKGAWLPPAEITFPSSSGLLQSLYLLTRGKVTHILPSPLPVPVSSTRPLKILQWESVPSRVVARACQRRANGDYFLQAISLSENGVEVLESPLTFLYSARGNGNGKERDETIVVYAEVGPGGAGFLRKGGHWADAVRQNSLPSSLQRHPSSSTVDTLEMAENYNREEGFYAWTRKGYHDWRVFWLGGNVEREHPSWPSS